ncbi:MAG: hypothetical protein F4Y03_13935 [Alphaproteobacteria bacterium]|nr:hypothetical protein [Alphaproteobacteria bacterium]
MRTMKNLALAAMAATALALAGCGGGGGGGTATAPSTPAEPPAPPAPAPVADVMIPDAMYLDEDNAPAAGSMTIAAGDSYTNNGVMFMCPADGDACEVEVMADGSVTSTGGEATAALTADAMVQVAQAKKDAADAAAMAAEQHRDRIIGKDRALEGASNLPATATADTQLDEDEIMITRGAGKMASVRVSGGTGIAGYAASSEPILPGDATWSAHRLMRSVSGATQHLFVYTDIGPPTRVQFYNWDGDPLTPRRYEDATLDAATDPATVATTIPPLSLATGGTPVAALFNRGNLDSNFSSPGPAEAGNVVQRFPMATAADQIVSFKGNFNGAPGTYSCDSGTADQACVITITPTGTYTSPDTWTFTPELNSTAWRNDTEFMSFGWWLQEPNSSDGTYTFQYYADGNDYTAPPGTIATGSATYSGRAAGKFVVQEIGDEGVTGGEAGMFTAAATLNARFGSAANSISGTIDGFQSDNANVDVSSWSVTLHRKTLGAQANLPNAFPAISETDPSRATYDGTTATLGDQTLHGDWAGEYFGDQNTGNTRNAYPLGVGGTFQADNEAASIAGAFGARR